MGSSNKGLRITKCEGRFPEVRDALVEALDVLVDNDSNYVFLRKQDLSELLDLSDYDNLKYKDRSDPYFLSKKDCLRADPAQVFAQDPELSLVPLITTDATVAQPLVIDYARSFGVNSDIRENSILFCKYVQENPDGVERLDDELDIDLAKLAIPLKESKKFSNLSGYKLTAGFGIGQNKLKSLAYDAPYHIEVHKIDPTKHRSAERTMDSGVLGIGFWINPNQEMLISQIQGMRGQRLPEGVSPGAAAFVIAEKVAFKMGFKSVITYTARYHPQFSAHPDSYSQLAEDFNCFYDSSARLVGWEPVSRPCPQGNHENYGFKKILR
jgi:hypothetical protein